MDRRYPIPGSGACVEIGVANSRFIATAAHTPSIEAARACIAACRATMPDATHHCYAYLVGYGTSVTAGMSDDGEPAGTAGRPMLAVLRGADLGDVTVVVTRYFGGTLLGTGGLVRAYSDAVKAVLAVLPRAERVELQAVVVRVTYNAYAAVRRLIEAVGGIIAAEEFAGDVRLAAQVPQDRVEQLSAELAEATAGQAQLEL